MGNSESKETEKTPSQRPTTKPINSTARQKTVTRPKTEESQSRYKHKNSKMSSRKSVKLGKGDVNFSVIKGDLTTEKADVVVCTTNKKLQLCKGRASKVLSEAAGPCMQQECDSEYPEGIEHDGKAVVCGGNLPCKKVYLVALPVWSSGNSGNVDILKNLILDCLFDASKYACKSIALPALGTGYLKYPSDIVAKTTLDCVEEFSSKKRMTSLKHVAVIVYYQDQAVFKAFESEAKRRADASPGGATASGGAMGGLGVPSRLRAKPAKFGLSSIMAVNKTEGSIKIHIKTGKLAEFHADVIVNNTANDLQLKNGGLSESLLDVAGPQLQNECDESHPNGIHTGDIVETGGYGLHCKKVYHGSLPKWDKRKGLNSKQMLTKFVDECLANASSDGFEKIAFPALGTGSLNYPADISAQAMFSCITMHEQMYPDSNLTDVYIIVYDGVNDYREVKETYKSELAKFHAPPVVTEESEAAKNYNFKLLESSLENAIGRGPGQGAPQRGTDDWFKYMFKNDPRPPNYWSVYHSNKTLKGWGSDMDDCRPHFIPVDQKTFDAVNKVVQDTWITKHVGQGRDAQGLGDLKYTNIRLRKVERIENVELFAKYAQRRQDLFKKCSKNSSLKALEKVKNSSGPLLSSQAITADTDLTTDIYSEINEHYCFHGTKPETVDVIVKQGLDSRLSGKGAMFGQGVYAAESSTKADQYADSKSNRSKGEKKMFLVRLLLGNIFIQNTAQAFARAPCTNCSQDKCMCSDNSFYNSVVGDGSWNFREFIVYEKAQVYPEYLITYVRE